MNRRDVVFALIALSAAPYACGAQQMGKIPRIGFLWAGSSAPPHPFIEAFEDGLRDLGWLKNQNVMIEYRYADGKAERYPDFAAELAHLPVNVIVAGPAPAAVAAKVATTTIPIVITLGADPRAFGLMENRTAQTGNITGLTEMLPALTPKRIALLKEVMPALTRVAILWQPDTLRKEAFAQMLKETTEAAQSLGIQVQVFEARAVQDWAAAFDEIGRARNEAVIVLMSPTFNARTKQLADLASKYRLPTIYESGSFATAGGLMSYGANINDIYRRAAVYVDRLLKGANPADLPVEEPNKLELVINLKTAKTLGLTIPQSILVRADRVIE